MVRGLLRRSGTGDAFERLHGQFIRHFVLATGFAWTASVAAASVAPWTRNLRGLLDPTARPESTATFLFGLPVLMLIGLATAVIGQDLFRRTAMFRNPAIEFAVAGAAVFAVFVMAVQRAVAAASLAF